jgi:hypothetical protein
VLSGYRIGGGVMKLRATNQNEPVAVGFLSSFLKKADNYDLFILSTDECHPFMFDCDAVELNNCFIEMERIGVKQVVKDLFQGSHPYRSDTGKCARCYRYVPEIFFDNENLAGSGEVCNRCAQYGAEL